MANPTNPSSDASSPVKVEPHPSPPQTTLVEQEQQDSAGISTVPATISDEQQVQESPSFQSHFSLPSSLIESMSDLRNLSAALSTFERCFDDLQNHLNSIRIAIDSKLPAELPSTSIAPPSDVPITHGEVPIVVQSDKNSSPQPPEERTLQSTRSELESLCSMMCSRGLRKYMVSHLSEVDRLREEVPKALRTAPNPGKLVLECSGRFFLQGSKAFTKDSPMIPAREASVLVLECLLLMGGVEIEKTVKEEAEMAAVAWRKRLINEGGLEKASEIDARGLLLLIGNFGVPGVFRNEDMGNLLRSSNVKGISRALRRSSILMARIPEIIDRMVKYKMEVDAVDIIYALGFEDKFAPQTILTSFLRESKESWKRMKKTSQSSLYSVNEANKKQLAALRSVIKCLESNKIDPSKLLPGWQINERIVSLEKETVDLEKKLVEKTMQKRKGNETESSKKLTEEAKRARFAINLPQQQNAVSPIDSRRNLLDISGPGYINRASPSALHESGINLVPEDVIGVVAGRAPSLLSAGAGPSISPAHTTAVLQASSYAGVQSRIYVDSTGRMGSHNSQLYRWREDQTLYDRYLVNRYAGQSLSAGFDGLYRQSPSLDSNMGLPSVSTVGIPGRSSASDLYHFADVVDSEQLSRTVGAVPSVVPGHSSYLY